MTIPANTKVWDETMDPYDILDYKVDLAPLLEVGESINTYSIVPLSESDLLGLEVGTSTYAPVLVGTTLTVWLSISSGFQSNAAFIGTGTTLPLEVSVTTTNTPPRKRQRTVAVKVAQR